MFRVIGGAVNVGGHCGIVSKEQDGQEQTDHQQSRMDVTPATLVESLRFSRHIVGTNPVI